MSKRRVSTGRGRSLSLSKQRCAQQPRKERCSTTDGREREREALALALLRRVMKYDQHTHSSHQGHGGGILCWPREPHCNSQAAQVEATSLVCVCSRSQAQDKRVQQQRPPGKAGQTQLEPEKKRCLCEGGKQGSSNATSTSIRKGRARAPTHWPVHPQLPGCSPAWGAGGLTSSSSAKHRPAPKTPTCDYPSVPQTLEVS